jgi:hypothetical protein
MTPPKTCSDHAITRFIERWTHAEVDYAPARQFAKLTLERLCLRAVHVEDCLNDLGGEGQSIWDLHGLEVPVRVAVTSDGVIRTVFERGAHEGVVHVRSQEDQPYGSERRCCSHCGIMLWGESSPPYVDNWTDWRALANNCGKKSS